MVLELAFYDRDLRSVDDLHAASEKEPFSERKAPFEVKIISTPANKSLLANKSVV